MIPTPVRRATSGMLLLIAIVISGCGGDGPGESKDPATDPSQVYARLVRAASEKDYGYLYDRLDAGMRENVDNLIRLSFETRDSMPEPERSFWDSVGRKSPRDAFAAIMASDPQMTANLANDYRVLDADTMVVLTIQRAGRAPELRYFQVEAGELRVSDPPTPPMADGAQPPGDPGTGAPRPNPGAAPAPDTAR